MGAKKKGKKKKGPPESGWWPGFVTKGMLITLFIFKLSRKFLQ